LRGCKAASPRSPFLWPQSLSSLLPLLRLPRQNCITASTVSQALGPHLHCFQIRDSVSHVHLSYPFGSHHVRSGQLAVVGWVCMTAKAPSPPSLSCCMCGCCGCCSLPSQGTYHIVVGELPAHARQGLSEEGEGDRVTATRSHNARCAR